LDQDFKCFLVLSANEAFKQFLVGCLGHAASGDQLADVAQEKVGVNVGHDRIPRGRLPWGLYYKFRSGGRAAQFFDENDVGAMCFPPAHISSMMRTTSAPEGVQVYNPAFDVPPAHLIAAIITEKGLIRPVNADTIRATLGIS
jgi:hypothetical protein